MRSVSRKAKQVIDVENLPFYQHWQRTDGEMIGLILHLEKSLSSQFLFTHAHMLGLSLYKEENLQLIKRKYIWTIQCLDSACLRPWVWLFFKVFFYIEMH